MDHVLIQNIPSGLSHGNAPIQVAAFQHSIQDTKDLGRVVLGGGYASVSPPANPPIARR